MEDVMATPAATKPVGAVLAWEAVELDASSQEEIRALFEEVFGHAMSRQLWEWKYGAGRGRATGARECSTQRLLAHYGGTQRVLWCSGQALMGVQLGDVMVHRQARGVLSRNGPFAVATRRFLDLHIGQGRAFDIGFGFPSARHVRLGEVLGLYVAAQPVMAVEWPPLEAAQIHAAHRRWRTAPLDWGQGSASARQLDGLWRRLSDSPLATQFVLGQRDASWWRHRYANHPESPYWCLWVHTRWTQRLLGAVVLRPLQGAWELLDWLCAPNDMAAVLNAALAHCSAQKGMGMQAWVSDSLWHQLHTASSWLATGTAQPACTAALTMQRSPTADTALQGRAWWLTGGDTDFR